MAISLILDPGATQLDLLASPFQVVSFNMPTPALDPRFAQPADADGDRLVGVRYLNRDITINVEIKPTDTTISARYAAGQAALASLADKVARTNREGLVLQYTTPAGDTIYFDLIAADPIDPPHDLEWDLAQVEKLTLKFTAAPFWRAGEIAIVSDGRGGYTWGSVGSATSITERTLPASVFTVPAVPVGDAPALGRLVVTEGAGADQLWGTWGMQSRYYSAASTAGLYFAASSLTAFTGALGSTSYKAILSTQATGGGSHMSHVGDFRVLARVRRGSGTGTFTMVLDWVVGGMLAWARNDTVTWSPGDSSSAERIFDFGIVSIPVATKGTQAWEGRILARSTVNGDTAPSPTHLYLVPVEASAELTASVEQAPPTSFAASASFDTGSGAITGSALEIGGTWVGAGASSSDWNYGRWNQYLTASRGFLADATTNLASGRIITASAPTTLTGTYLTLRIAAWGANSGATGALTGAVVRYVNSTNFIAVVVRYTGPAASDLAIVQRLAGVDTVLASSPITNSGADPPYTTLNDGTLNVSVTTDGRIAAQLDSVSRDARLPQTATVAATTTAAATGGALDDGTVGLVDRATTAGGSSQIDSLVAYSLVTDAVAYARRSAEVRFDGALRETSSGSAWGGVSRAEGDLLKLPVAGPEQRSLRFLVKLSRVIPSTGPDPATDALTTQLFATPRGLAVP